tara:strand:- start:981 stop:1433 length:453 start_codon:yes stop_codon:yes gene_type:complete
MKNEWILIENPFSTRPYSRFNKHDYKTILENQIKPECKQMCLFTKAIEKDHAVGKWMLRVNSKHRKKVWKWVKTNTLNGNLGCSANISKRKCRGRYTICVHNFFDELDDTIRIYNELKKQFEDVVVNEELKYKPDIYGYLNIYGKRYGIK